MDQYINLKGFENSANGAQLKNSKYHIVELNITFYKTPIIFIEYVLEDPVSVHENTHIFTDMDEFVLFLKKYTYDGTAIMFENDGVPEKSIIKKDSPYMSASSQESSEDDGSDDGSQVSSEDFKCNKVNELLEIKPDHQQPPTPGSVCRNLC